MLLRNESSSSIKPGLGSHRLRVASHGGIASIGGSLHPPRRRQGGDEEGGDEG